MNTRINNVEITVPTYNQYIDDLINKVFKILPIFEECVQKSTNNKFVPYLSYLDKIVTIMTGAEAIFQKKDFIILVSLFKGMQKRTDLTKTQIKSLVFHCIDILEKMKV